MEILEPRKTQVLSVGTKGHILHIEDDQEVAGLVVQVLNANGYKVTHAKDGISGLLAFTERPNRWAAILIDLTLPHFTGNSLLKEMHRIRPELPIIVLTGAEPEDSIGVYELGAALVWQKPISPSELLEHLKAVLDH
jgi:DNA-binding response OmpR family regulator